MAKPSRSAFPADAAKSEIIKSESWDSDCYTGSAAALIDAGHVTPAQLPGLPGRNKISTAFTVDGSPVSRGKNGATAVRVILVRSGIYRVEVRLTPEERAARGEVKRRAREAAHEEAVGPSGVLFEAGAWCTDVSRGEPAEIVSGYGLHVVRVGEDSVFRRGYIARNATGRYFYPAGLLWSAAGRPRHLRLVSSSDERATASQSCDRQPCRLRLVSSTNVERAPIVL